jgi:UDP-N-acetylmuramate dehydrogenase
LTSAPVDIVASLAESCRGRVVGDFPLASMTTFRIGGPADVFVEAESVQDLVAATAAAREAGIEVMVLGKGSNVLVSDSGFRGMVIRLGRGFRWSRVEGSLLSAGAAMPLPALAGVAAAEGLSGVEFCIAIPGSFGGGVRMNAGAHGGTMADVVETVEVFSIERSEASTVTREEAGFRYRGSDLAGMGIVTAARLGLEPADPEQIRERMAEARVWRKQTQPLAEPNCGSVFRNPPEGHAARLIDESGAKGMSVGGASVSAKHANFIVASEGATASDVITLIEHVQHRVEDVFGVRLEREVQLVGDFGVGRD